MIKKSAIILIFLMVGLQPWDFLGEIWNWPPFTEGKEDTPNW